MRFLENLDKDLRQSVLCALRDLWTHTSTALEGNTLSLGDTAFVLNEGLTIGGKPLKDHQEVLGHAKAIELVYGLMDKPVIDEADLFLIHRAVQIEAISDILKPVGDWKKEPNGTYARSPEGKTVYVEYAAPQHVQALMQKWLTLLNGFSRDLTEAQALKAYAMLHLSFVTIHPFFDGNGRMARLLANLPVLRAGQVPVVIDCARRQEYIELLSAYQRVAGQIGQTELIVENDEYQRFEVFCESCRGLSLEIVHAAYETQRRR
ncbi:MAG: Fic family protein [Sulfuricellaceae bacterium]|nr:Fic family protein [Sulfuricellaceae bacterium]